MESGGPASSKAKHFQFLMKVVLILVCSSEGNPPKSRNENA